MADGGSTYTDAFLAESRAIIDQLDREAIERVAGELAALRSRGGRLFFVGSGGGAGHASHAVNDFRKIGGIEAYTPTDNVSELTARINDDGWETSYVEWLRVSRMGPDDMLFVFSVGGGDEVRGISVNLVRCVEYAIEVGSIICGLVGRDGGHLARRTDRVILVPTLDPATVTAQTEGFQSVLWHLLVSHPAIQQMPTKWESVK
ncbi:MAG: SIS domain-containing protein [Chloroflexota bacterium]|nr:SIS domain-containing protein [Chloroflexota bacterium]